MSSVGLTYLLKTDRCINIPCRRGHWGGGAPAWVGLSQHPTQTPSTLPSDKVTKTQGERIDLYTFIITMSANTLLHSYSYFLVLKSHLSEEPCFHIYSWTMLALASWNVSISTFFHSLALGCFARPSIHS